MSTTVGASAAEQGKLPEIGREPKPDDHNQMAAQQRRNNKRIIPFAHGAFTVDSDTLASAKASWTIGERVHDSIAQFGDTSRSEHAQSKKQKKGDPAAASAAAAAPIHKPSVRQVQVSTYRRFAFGTNRIQSARYTLLSFLPLNLWEQIVPWNKPANTYFICIAILQSIAAISTTNGRPSILVPLVFVLAVTAIKDAIEDYHRAQSDKAKNDAVYLVWRAGASEEEQKEGQAKAAASPSSSSEAGRWVPEYSKDILVGDFIRIDENQRIPADVLLVASGIDRGTHVFIDTKDLDGETNLKPKFVPNNIQKFLSQQSAVPASSAAAAGSNGAASSSSSSSSDQSDDKNTTMLRRLSTMSGELECDPPNGDMGEWHASLAVEGVLPGHAHAKREMDLSPGGSAPGDAIVLVSSGGKTLRQNLGLDALILADCVLRNTPFAIGMACYVGDQTKLRTNMHKQLHSARMKETTVFRLTKKLFLWMACLQVILCLAAAIACAILQNQIDDSAFYLRFSSSPTTAGVLQFFTWFILCKDLLPISLYVSMELVQFWQAQFIGMDKAMSVQVTKVREPEQADANGRKSEAVVEQKDGKQWNGDKQKGDKNGDGRSSLKNIRGPSSSAAASPGSSPQSNGSPSSSSSDLVETETIFAKAQTSRLNEELAQVSYVFSDKTGTLTSNSMCFKKCVIGTRTYGKQSTEAGVIRKAKLEGGDIAAALKSFEENRQAIERARVESGEKRYPHVEFDQRNELLIALWKDEHEKTDASAAGKAVKSFSEAILQSTTADASSSSSAASAPPPHSAEVREFLLALALNNAVFPKVDPVRSGPPDPQPSGGAGGGEHQPPSNGAPAGGGGNAKNSKYDLTRVDTNAVMSLDSSSPDEKALCYFAAYAGVELFSRAGGKARLRITGPNGLEFVEYAEVALLDFSAKRKRMTVLVEPLSADGKPSGVIRVFCKGADSFVYPLLAGADPSSIAQQTEKSFVDVSGMIGNDPYAHTRPVTTNVGSLAAAGKVLGDGPKNWATTYESLVEFGGESLRTLVVAGASKPAQWWYGDSEGRGSLKTIYDHTQRQQGPNEKGHADGSCSLVCAMCAIESRIELEAGLELIGATAIEDQLQPQVGSALKSLLDAQIHVWMLTGDNVSTAINIGISCNLLEADFEADGRLFKLDKEQAVSLDSISEVLKAAHDMVYTTRRSHPEANFGLALHSDAWKMLFIDEEDEQKKKKKASKEKKKKHTANGKHDHDHADQLDSLTLRPSTSTRASTRLAVLDRFFSLTTECRSVIACRLEPREKAQIVEEMRRRTGKVCLAIGDGNNDVPMIKSSDIGVGIRGVEGTGAVSSADYSISEFRFLARLLLVYGHLNYRRMSLLICYIFYKSSMLTWTAYFLGAYSAYSGQSLTMDWTFQLYNIAYTALPILIYAVLDRDFTHEVLSSHPLIYASTRGDTFFNPWVILRWIVWGFLDSAICFFLSVYSYDLAQASENGEGVGFVVQGFVVYTAVVMVVNFKLFWFVRSWTWLHVFAFLLSFAAYWLATLIFNASSFFSIGGLDYFHVLSFVGSQSRFWLTLLLCVGASACVNLIYIALWETMWPRRPMQIYYEAMKRGMDLNEVDRQYLECEAKATAKEAAKDASSRANGTGALAPQKASSPNSSLPSVRSRANQVGQSSGSGHTPEDKPGQGANLPAGPKGVVMLSSPSSMVSSHVTHVRFHVGPDASPSNANSDKPEYTLGPTGGGNPLWVSPEPTAQGSTPGAMIGGGIFRQPDPTKRVLSALKPKSANETADRPDTHSPEAPRDAVSPPMLMQVSPTVVHPSGVHLHDGHVNLDRVLSNSMAAATPRYRQTSPPELFRRLSSGEAVDQESSRTTSGSYPYTGFAFNHTPIGKLVQINRFQFEPVHEAHQIPEEPSSSQPEASK